MRGDGVKIIWTEQEMKTFHADGTVFITKNEEGYIVPFLDEHIPEEGEEEHIEATCSDIVITQSSSHAHSLVS